ncbi:MAG TPA: hypothetical protein V6C81_27215 [Planktothrix sp.]|jgi:hypothetical protein
MLLSYKNSAQIKERFLQELQQMLDQMPGGLCLDSPGLGGWNSSYDKYTSLTIGIPGQLVYVHDALWNGVGEERARIWPLEFAGAVNVGVELNTVWPLFAVRLLTEVSAKVQDEALRAAIDSVSRLYQENAAATDVRWTETVAALQIDSPEYHAADVAVGAAEARSRKQTRKASEAVASALTLLSLSGTNDWQADREERRAVSNRLADELLAMVASVGAPLLTA